MIMAKTETQESDTRAGWHRHPNGGGWVEDTANVDASARVSGDAWVYGDARVYGDAWVSGDAWVLSVLYIQGSKHPLTTSSYSEITIGCHSHTIKHWLENYKKIGKQSGYTDQEIEEYRDLIKCAVKWLEQKGYRK